MKINDLLGKIKKNHIFICGNKKRGKTNLVKYILTRKQDHLVFDPHNEYKRFNQLIPETPAGKQANKELAGFMEKIIKPQQHKIRDLVLDEVNMYSPKGGDIDGPVGEAVHWGSSHWNMNIYFLTRRPQDVHTSIRGLADYYFIFQTTGDRAKNILDNIISGLGEKARNLDKYEFLLITPGRDIYEMDPVPNMDW